VISESDSETQTPNKVTKSHVQRSVALGLTTMRPTIRQFLAQCNTFASSLGALDMAAV